MNKNFFCVVLLISLVIITNKVSAQFVPFSSGIYKHLATDTLYNLTGCGVPGTTPNSYRRVVSFYDSCGHTNYQWQPEYQQWNELQTGGGEPEGSFFIDTTFTLTGISNRVTIPHTLSVEPKRVEVDVDNDEGLTVIAPFFDENNVYIDYNVAPICNCTYTIRITPESP